jgi:hypothetical protein
MTEERIIAAFRRLDVVVDPDPAFADRLFVALAGEVEWGTMPATSLNGRLRRALGLGPTRTRGRTLRLAYLLVMLALLVAALGVALFVASRLETPTLGDLVRESQAAYEDPPAFAVTYRMPMTGDMRLSSDGAGTWRIESADEGPGTYWLWDGDRRVGHYDPATVGWVAGTSKDVGIIGPPGPLWMEYTWGTGEIYADDPVRHVIPCVGAIAESDARVIVGHATDHVRCPDIGMHYWLDRETHLILAMEAGPATPHWSGVPGLGEVAVEATAFSVGAQPEAAFDWRGPADDWASPSAAVVVPLPSLPAVSAGIASDQPCVAEVQDPAAVTPVGIAPHELEALMLDAADLGVSGDGWSTDPWLGAWMHNIEVAVFDPPAEDTCEALARMGRVIGYRATYSNETNGDQLTESVDVFLTEDGAASYVTWFATAMATTIDATSRPVEAGDGGLLITSSTANGDRRWVVFRSGTLVATIGFQGQSGHTPPAKLTQLAAALAARITGAAFTGIPYDLAQLMSATVPKADLPRAFLPLGWDPVFGGCWDQAEMIAQSSDPEQTERDIATFGREISCLGMYSPDGECGVAGCPTPPPDTGAPVGVIRVATGFSVLASPSSAQGLFDVTLARIEGSGAERFDVPDMPGAVGLRRHIVDGDIAEVDTRIMFVRGNLLALAYVYDRTDSDHTADVIEMAKALDARIAAVLGGGEAR